MAGAEVADRAQPPREVPGGPTSLPVEGGISQCPAGDEMASAPRSPSLRCRPSTPGARRLHYVLVDVGRPQVRLAFRLLVSLRSPATL